MDGQPGYAFAPAAEPAPLYVAYGPWAHLSKSLGALGAASATLLVLQAVLALASAGSAGWTVVEQAGTSGPTGLEQVVPPARTMALALTTSGLTVVTGLVFACWLFRAATNNVLCGVRPRRGPGWAWGSWFVPVVNLWWPKQVVDDVVRGSRTGVAAGTDVRWLPPSGLVSAWWVTWLLSGALSGVGATIVVRELVRLQLTTAPQDLAAHLSGLDLARLVELQALWTMWGSIAACLSACCAVALVTQTTGHQQRRRELALARVAPGPWP